MKISANKRRTPLPACTLCVFDNERLSRLQCICPELHDALIGAHHNLVTLLWGRLDQASAASQQWDIHSEMQH